MKRNKSGINFDLGLPLESEWELQNLYVSVHKELQSKIEHWLKRGNNPLFIGGQIGSGKSTIIRNVFHTTSIKPDIEFHFDRDAINLSLGDFWRIILAELIAKALDVKADLSVLDLPHELAELENHQWKELLDILKPPRVELVFYTKRKKIQDKIVELPDFVDNACSQLLEHIEKKLAKKTTLFASGIDKYAPDSAAFFDLMGPLRFLMSKKTLFELNVVHLFRPLFFSETDQSLLVYAVSKNKIREMLKKRMGIYSKGAAALIDTATKWSGGNPRQALRMLIILRNSRGKTKDEITIKAVRNLFFEYFAYSPKPEDDLLNVIKQQGYIEPTLLILPGDKETAQRAVYGNWVLLQKRERHQSKLQAIINPIVVYSVSLRVKPDHPEVQLLRRYAKQKQISPTGLDFNHDVITSKLWESVLQKQFDRPVASNLTEILDVLESSLFSKDRADRTIIVYRNPDILKIARTYLFAKANTYEYQSFRHVVIEDSNDEPPAVKLLELTKENIDILSIDFLGDKWSEKSLIEIDKIRDKLLDHQMIWWIPERNLSRNLYYWTQLRQLFQVFVLEDELLSSLSKEEIQSDIDFFKDLAEGDQSSEANVVNNLKTVLAYLKQQKER